MKSEPVGMRENKSGKFFPQYFASGFGKNFPSRKFQTHGCLLEGGQPEERHEHSPVHVPLGVPRPQGKRRAVVMTPIEDDN